MPDHSFIEKEFLQKITNITEQHISNEQFGVSKLARETGVSYLVEGSGQKSGDKILLNIQLIDAKTDKHLWAEQYARETGDIFELQQEVAQKIAGEIEVIITPEEAKRISEVPTDNLVAYDYFLQGLDLLKKR